MKKRLLQVGLIFLLCGLSLFLFVGRDYIPRQTFIIQTVDGQTIKLSCPVVDTRRSTWTYLIDGECVIEP
ncbi:MAG: hypothetical protein A2X55_08970 [Nitrospirae bacterium GWB2_47_37]|nr:MAG: hypothetical protein A2X55_08970 [Nitrospirae bacterium GWB2_47_37]HAK87642.1 hypothetical protein [Nitrospiraceae bacterium]